MYSMLLSVIFVVIASFAPDMISFGVLIFYLLSCKYLHPNIRLGLASRQSRQAACHDVLHASVGHLRGDRELRARYDILRCAHLPICYLVSIFTLTSVWGWLADTRGRRPVMMYFMLLSVIFAVIASFAPDMISFGVLIFLPAIFILTSVWGWLADTRGRRPVMIYFMLLSVIFAVIASFAPDMISFGVLLFLSAIFTSGSSAVVYTYLGEFNNLRHRDKMVAFGSSLLVVAFSFPFAIGTALLAFAPESPKFLSVLGNHEAALEVSMSSKSTETGFKAVLVSMKEQTLPLFKMPLLPWISLACFVQFVLFIKLTLYSLYRTNGFYVWFPTILNSLANHDGGETKICDVLDASRVPHGNGTERSIYIGLVFSSMYLLVGFLVDIVGKKLILITVLGITGLCGIGAHLAYNQQLAVVLFAVFQMSGACIGLMNAVSVELFPTKFR
ncbi:SV2-like protein 1 [Operophtera brumata]|uniref:SV2-like protein 1 n=1 Tax=Operophtera brumata TaxID=104452 RepID=A0A0L7KZW6_OPEBR|nr:SV2-like protein 1 [Operophtera brumata]